MYVVLFEISILFLLFNVLRLYLFDDVHNYIFVTKCFKNSVCIFLYPRSLDSSL